MEFFNDHVLCFSKIKGIVMSVEVDVKNTEVLLPEQLELTLLMWVFFLFLRLYTQDLVNLRSLRIGILGMHGLCSWNL